MKTLRNSTAPTSTAQAMSPSARCNARKPRRAPEPVCRAKRGSTGHVASSAGRSFANDAALKCAGVLPFVVLFGQDGVHQTNDCTVIGEDADHVRARLGLPAPLAQTRASFTRT